MSVCRYNICLYRYCTANIQQKEQKQYYFQLSITTIASFWSYYDILDAFVREGRSNMVKQHIHGIIVGSGISVVPSIDNVLSIVCEKHVIPACNR